MLVRSRSRGGTKRAAACQLRRSTERRAVRNPALGRLVSSHRTRLIMHRKSRRCLDLFVVRTKSRLTSSTEATEPAAQIEAHLWLRQKRAVVHDLYDYSSAASTLQMHTSSIARASIATKRTSGMASDRDPAHFAKKVSKWRTMTPTRMRRCRLSGNGRADRYGRHEGAKLPFTKRSQSGWNERRIEHAPPCVAQRSTCSEIANASSTSIPR